MSLTIDLCGYDKLEVAGGPIVWLRRIPQVLRDQGVDVRIRLLSWHEPHKGVVFQSLRNQGFAVAGHQFADTQTNIRWFLTQINSDPPNIFVPNLVTPAFFAGRWARAASIPTVGVLHSDDEFYRAIQSEFIFGQPEFAVSCVVGVSRELERQVSSKNPPRTTTARIPYGVPIPSATAQRNETGLRLGFVGRLAEEQKRISDVTRALCRAVRAVPHTQAIIFGDGPDRDNVEKILSSEGAGLPVTLAGNVPSEEIRIALD